MYVYIREKCDIKISYIAGREKVSIWTLIDKTIDGKLNYFLTSNNIFLNLEDSENVN